MILKKKLSKEEMYDDNNIFAKIIRSEMPCDKVYEDDNVLFFHDINPIAKIHILGIPKIKCINFADFIEQANEKTIKDFFNNILDVVKMLGLKKSGYRLITNSGLNGGQEVLHYHVHIIGGEPLGNKIR